MGGKKLTVLLILLGAALGLTLFASDRSISRWIEDCGEYISQAFGF
jgi:hypothetical protein